MLKIKVSRVLNQQIYSKSLKNTLKWNNKSNQKKIVFGLKMIRENKKEMLQIVFLEIRISI